MAKFSKHILSDWVYFECERQLFLYLGENDDSWIRGNSKLEPPDHYRKISDVASLVGKDYEQAVYVKLINVGNTSPKIFQGEVRESKSLKNTLRLLHDNFEQETFLLEHSFGFPLQYAQKILGDKDKVGESLRPDILSISSIATGPEFELLPDGVRELSSTDRRLAINIFDIKSSSPESIGKSHFIEVLLYCHVLSSFLSSHGLLDMYYVRVSGNGVFPHYGSLNFGNFDDFREGVIMLEWDEYSRLYDHAISVIQGFTFRLPLEVEAVPVNIQPSCGRCRFLEDCKKRLSWNSKDLGQADVKLISHIGMSNASRLNEANLCNVADVAERLDDFPIRSIPEPIFSQLPILKLKAQSLVTNTVVHPEEGSLLSIKIPKFSNISIILNCEANPLYEKVFGVSIKLNIFASADAEYRDIFELFFSEFHQYIKGKVKNFDSKTKVSPEIQVKQDSEAESDEDDTVKQANQRSQILKIRETLQYTSSSELSLRTIQRLGKQLLFFEKNSSIKTKWSTGEKTFYEVMFSYVSGNVDDTSEFTLAQQTLDVLYSILSFATDLEEIMTVNVEQLGKKFDYAPITALYYWSDEIVKQIEEMLERTFARLLLEPSNIEKLRFLSTWFGPSDSSVKDANHGKKTYNLRDFTESSLGFPVILNYTWHEIYDHLEDKFKFIPNSRFWIKHFNYMDYAVWEELVLEKNMTKQGILHAEMRRQLEIKVDKLDAIRIAYQRTSRRLISRSSIPVSQEKMQSNRVPDNFHEFANIWYLFSKLTGTAQELEAEHLRTMFPEYSIGKLLAGEVNNLTVFQQEGTRGGLSYTYHFRLSGLSSNMKIKEKDNLLLIPIELRDYYKVKEWKISIKRMDWDSTESCYKVESEKTSQNYFEKLREATDGRIQDSSQWYLYPWALDVWSDKLFGKKNSLLEQHNFGTSWLARRLANLWGINSREVSFPEGKTFSIPECYIYYPESLNATATSENITSLKRKYVSNPNDSQLEAIYLAQNRIVSGIIGPPGTGKSQTIAILINEIIQRAQKPVRILVTAFSYEALNVVLKKLNELTYFDGEKKSKLHTQKIFLRSKFRNPAVGAHDLINSSGNTWRFRDRTRLFTKGKTLLNHFDDSFILLGVPHQIYKLNKLHSNGKKYVFPQDFAFDYIICDEASQMPVDQFLASLLFTTSGIAKILDWDEDRSETFDIKQLSLAFNKHPNQLTKVILVGDNNQLPPVQPVEPPNKLKPVLGSIFSYFIEHHKIPEKQLLVNYRSNQVIVDFIASMGLYKTLTAFQANSELRILGEHLSLSETWLQRVMNPEIIVSSLIHTGKYDTAISMLEAKLTVRLTIAFLELQAPDSSQEEEAFWMNSIGIVAPHNAHGRLIIRMIFDELIQTEKTKLTRNALLACLKNTIFSVEKFQGSDREFIIGTVGISSKEQLRTEERFIYQINRFNVLISRAKAKVVFICSQNYLNYFPSSLELMQNATKIRSFAMSFCDKSETFKIKIDDTNHELVFKYK